MTDLAELFRQHNEWHVNDRDTDDRAWEATQRLLQDGMLPDPIEGDYAVYTHSVHITIPWNPEYRNSFIDELLGLGWTISIDKPRTSDSYYWVTTFVHPDYTYYHHGDYYNNIRLILNMRAYDDSFRPEGQNCHLVQIDTQIVTKEVPIYDVICDESFNEMNGGDE